MAFLLAGVGAFAGVRGWARAPNAKASAVRGHHPRRHRGQLGSPQGVAAHKLEQCRGRNAPLLAVTGRDTPCQRVHFHARVRRISVPGRSGEVPCVRHAQTVDRSTTGRVVASPAALPPHAPTDHHDRALTAGATSVAQDLDLPETIVGLHECVSRQRRALPLQVAVVLQMMLIPAEEMFSLSPTVRYAWPLVAFGVVPLILHFLLPRKHGVPQALALGRHRLRFVRGDVELLSLPWEMVSGATCSRWTGKFRILGNGGSDLYVCRHDRFGGLRTVRRAAEQITATARERNHAPICDAPARASLESEGAPRA